MSLFEAYRDKTVFLTGYTGFVGDLLFKSMQRLPVKRIFVLSRKPVVIDDSRAINLLGDITLPNFGLSEENLKAIGETEFFIHLAAYTRWDTDLRHQVIQKEQLLYINGMLPSNGLPYTRTQNH